MKATPLLAGGANRVAATVPLPAAAYVAGENVAAVMKMIQGISIQRKSRRWQKKSQARGKSLVMPEAEERRRREARRGRIMTVPGSPAPPPSPIGMEAGAKMVEAEGGAEQRDCIVPTPAPTRPPSGHP